MLCTMSCFNKAQIIMENILPLFLGCHRTQKIIKTILATPARVTDSGTKRLKPKYVLAVNANIKKTKNIKATRIRKNAKRSIEMK